MCMCVGVGVGVGVGVCVCYLRSQSRLSSCGAGCSLEAHHFLPVLGRLSEQSSGASSNPDLFGLGILPALPSLNSNLTSVLISQAP